VGQVGETCNAVFKRGFVADMQDHSGCDRRGGILPVPFLRTILARAHYHVGDILGVAHIARREQPYLAQWIES
jgi:hypothetical protein